MSELQQVADRLAKLKALNEELDQLAEGFRKRLGELVELKQKWSSVLLGKNSTLAEEVSAFEGRLIKVALQASDGQVTKAAALLGISYQGLAHIVEVRHPELKEFRSARRKRRSKGESS